MIRTLVVSICILAGIPAWTQPQIPATLTAALNAAVRLPHERPSPQTIAEAYDAAEYILTASRPPGIEDLEWSKVQATAHKALGWAYMQRRQFGNAEKSFVFTLEHLSAGDSETSNWLGLMLLKSTARPGESAICLPENDVRCPEALFHIARAAFFQGEGAFPPEVRKVVEQTMIKTYKAYHGSDEGLSELRTLALASVLPPKDLHITRHK